jgi:enterochelin esterase-like enzyme
MSTALKKLLLAVSGGFTLVLLTGSWYVFMAAVRQYGVILPPGYNDGDSKDGDSKDSNSKDGKGRRYQLIILLHGGHDDARAWYSKIGIIPVLHDLYRQQKLPLSIVITPDGNDRRGSSPLFDPDYYDGPDGIMGTLIGSELLKVISARYRTLQGPQYWVFGGLSTGGWGALNIGPRHLDQYNLFFSQISYFTDRNGPANSPQALITKIPANH